MNNKKKKKKSFGHYTYTDLLNLVHQDLEKNNLSVEDSNVDFTGMYFATKNKKYTADEYAIIKWTKQFEETLNKNKN